MKRSFSESSNDTQLNSTSRINNSAIGNYSLGSTYSQPIQGLANSTNSIPSSVSQYHLPPPSFGQARPEFTSISNDALFSSNTPNVLPTPLALQNRQPISSNPDTVSNIPNHNQPKETFHANNAPNPSTFHSSNEPAIVTGTAPFASSDPKPQEKKTFRRSYKACLNCRFKKIKCDLGDLASPSEPPCARCRREGKKCEFSVSRRGTSGASKQVHEKRLKTTSSHSGEINGPIYDDTINNNGIMARAKSQTNLGSNTESRAGSQEPVLSSVRSKVLESAMNKHFSNTSHSQSPIPLDTSNPSTKEVSSQAFTADELHNPSDALDILAHAADIQNSGGPGQESANISARSSETPEASANSQRMEKTQNSSHRNGAQSVINSSGFEDNLNSLSSKPSSYSASQRINESYTRMPIDTLVNLPESNSSAEETNSGSSSYQKSKESDIDKPKIVGADACSKTDLDSEISRRFTLHPSLLTAQVVQDRCLTAKEALLFIKFFFEGLHPFYPYIPESLQSTEVIVSMPILLTAILTISSRYCKYTEHGSEFYISAKRGSSIHRKLWGHCAKLMATSAWGEASTRSIGTVYAFLILSEWNPKAIHWRSNDYANTPLKPTLINQPGLKNSKSRARSVEQSVTSPKKKYDDQSSDESDDEEIDKSKPVLPPGDTVFSASERSDRMAWIIIGTSIRLAQDLGLFEKNSKVFLATHISEINLALRLGRRSMLQASLNEDIPDLVFTPFEEAQISLLRIMSLAHQTIYPSKKVTRELREGQRHLSLLHLLGSLLLNWENSYGYLVQEDGLEKYLTLFDYHYTRLYIFSFALSNRSSAGFGDSKIHTDRQSIPSNSSILSAKYIGLAVDAAYQMINIVQKVHEMERLCLAPIRWVLRLVHAAVFLVKTVLVSSVEDMYMHRGTLEVIKATAVALKDSSPDHLHLANRYASILNNWVEETWEKCVKDDTDNTQKTPKNTEKYSSNAPQTSENSDVNKETPHPVAENSTTTGVNSSGQTPIRGQNSEPLATKTSSAEVEKHSTHVNVEAVKPSSGPSQETNSVSNNTTSAQQLQPGAEDVGPANAYSPSFEQLFSYSSQDPGANSNLFLSGMSNQRSSTWPNAAPNKAVSGASPTSTNPSFGFQGTHANYNGANRKNSRSSSNGMNSFDHPTNSSLLTGVTPHPNSATNISDPPSGNKATTDTSSVGTNAFNNKDNKTNNNRNNGSPAQDFDSPLNLNVMNNFNHSSSNATSTTGKLNSNNTTTATPNSSGTGAETFSSFDFNFLADGYEGLGFVDQLMSGMETELEKKESMEKGYK